MSFQEGGMSLEGDLKAKISLTPSELSFFEHYFIEKLGDLNYYMRFVEQFQQPVYRRIKKIEEHHNSLKDGDIILLLAAVNPDGEGFSALLKDSDSWIDAVKFGKEERISIAYIFIAAKFLLGLPRQHILDDEVDKELRCRATERGQQGLYEFQKKGNLEKLARWAATRRVDRAKKLALVQLPFLIRGFIKEMTAKAKPSSSVWVRRAN